MHHSTKMIHAHRRPWKRAAAVQLIALASLLLPVLCQAQTPPVYTISTVAGSGTAGFAGDGADPLAANIYGPTGIFVDSKGNLYIADQVNNVIRLVSGGKISTVAGTNAAGYSGDGGLATKGAISSPDSVVLDSKGNFYFSEVNNGVVRMVTAATGNISTVAGNQSLGSGDLGDGSVAISAQLNAPAGVAVDANGTLYIADNRNAKIRKVAGGNISTIAGSGTVGYLGDGVPATSAHLNAPRQIALDAAGTLYIADSGSNEVRKVSGGVITLVAGSKTGAFGFSGDGGQATSALLYHPTGVAVDSAGNVYIADSFNERIRMVTPNGIINTIAGTGTLGYTGDGGAALSAQFNEPTALAVDGAGDVYVADFANNVIRKLTPGAAPGGGGAAPAIRTSTGVQSAGDFGAFATVAPGSWIEIYGSNLAADTRQWATGDFNGNTAPTSLDRTTVTIGGQSAFVAYVSPGQVNAQVPGNIGSGPLAVTVSTAAGTSANYAITANAQQPGLYAPPAYGIVGKQYVAALFNDFKTYVFPPGSFSGITSRQAKPGETIVIYGIGFGAVPGTPPGQIAQTANGLTLPIAPKFFFGKTQASVQYAGLVAGSVGLYQFNVIVPSIPDNDAVALTFTVNVNGVDVPGTQTLYTAVKQ